MKKFFASSVTVIELLKKHDDFSALRAILEAAIKVANGRTLVLPQLKGEYFPFIFARVPNIEVLPRQRFEHERAAAFSAMRQARVEHDERAVKRAERWAEQRDERIARFLGVKDTGRVFSAEEFAERSKARLVREARVAQNRARRNAECQERRGSSSGGAKKGKAT